MKQILSRIFLFIATFFLLFSTVYGDVVFEPQKEEIQTDTSKIYFSVFTRPECLHCIELKKFLEKEYASGSIAPKYYDISNFTTKLLYTSFVEKHNLTKVTPIILIGNTVIEGFDDEETTGRTIKEATAKLTKSSLFEDKNLQIDDTFKGKGCEADGATGCEITPTGIYVKIPFLGVRNLQDYSLPILSVVLGFVDGFNPCAMWVLVMFLSILTQSGSRKKMMQIAGTFILAETVMYFAILNVWYKTWDFVKLDGIVTPIIGIVSIGAGVFFLYEFFTNKDGECKVTSADQKRKTVQRIKHIVESPMTFGIFLATIGIAFSVNIIEFACSIGIPQAFTKILEMSSLGLLEKQFYVILYTLFYMVDDLIVFGIAIYAFQYLHLTTKYTRYCLVLGGIIMILLGYLFIFNPALLKLIIA